MLKRLISLGLSALMIMMLGVTAFAYDEAYYNPYYYEDSPYDTPPPTQGGGFTSTPQQGGGTTNPDGSWGNHWNENNEVESRQLDTPQVSVNSNVEVGETLFITWNSIENADYYTIQSWTTDEYFDDITSTSYSLSFDNPGTYAISVYARSYDRDTFPQSEPYAFNINVTSSESYTRPEETTTTPVASINDLHNSAYNKASAYGGIKVYVNGSKLYMDVAPEIMNGRTMVPLRAIFEALGATVHWDGSTSTVTAYRDSDNVELQLGSYTLYINNGRKSIDQPAYISGGRTLVPVRAISEAFNCDVQWYQDKKVVSIVANEEHYRALVPSEDATNNSTIEVSGEGNGYVTYDNGRETKVFLQNQGPWANMKVENGTDVKTDCCGLLSLKNAIYYLYDNQEEYNIPVRTLVDFCDENGFMTKGLGWGYYSAFAKSYPEYGFAVKQNNELELAKKCLLNDGVVIVSTTNINNNKGHLMVIVDYNQYTDEYLILDSYPTSSRFNSEAASWQKMSLRTEKAGTYLLSPASNLYAKQFWCITKK